MKTVKIKTIAIFTAILIVLTPSGTVCAASWADDMIKGLALWQITEITPENPGEYITREDFYIILARAALFCDADGALALENASNEIVFEDAGELKNGNYPYMAYLYDKGILNGTADGEKLYIKPGEYITRQDAAVFIGRWLGVDANDSVDAGFSLSDAGDVADYAYNTVWRLKNAGVISGYPDGNFKPLNNMTFAEASGMIFKSIGLIRPLLADNKATVKIYSGSGIIGNANGAGFETKYAIPQGLCLDNSGNLIVFDTYNAGIKRIKGGKTETVSGFSDALDDYGFTRAYHADGNNKDALFGRPTDGVFSSNGDLFIADSENNAIRLIRGDTVYTLAGGSSGYADGEKANAKFNYPTAIAIDKDGSLFVADTNNHCIRKVSPDGAVQTIAGSPQKPGLKDGNVSAAQFREPSGIAIDERGVIYIADTGNHTIRKIESGVVTTIAGTPGKKSGDYAEGGYRDGFAKNAEFKFPRGLYWAEDTLFIADTGNHAVRMLTGNGVVATVAGNGEPGDRDGAPISSMLNKPTAVVYKNGLIYIADSLNNKIKIVDFGPEK